MGQTWSSPLHFTSLCELNNLLVTLFSNHLFLYFHSFFHNTILLHLPLVFFVLTSTWDLGVILDYGFVLKKCLRGSINYKIGSKYRKIINIVKSINHKSLSMINHIQISSLSLINLDIIIIFSKYYYILDYYP